MIEPEGDERDEDEAPVRDGRAAAPPAAPAEVLASEPDPGQLYPPLERVLRGLLLALFLPLAFLPLLLARGRSVLEFLLFACLIGLLATPAAFAEVRLRGRPLPRRLLGAALLAPVLLFLAYLAVAQVIFTASVIHHGNREGALREAARFLLQRARLRDTLAYLGPSAIGMTLITLLRTFDARLALQLILAPVVTLGLSLALSAATKRLDHGEGREFLLLGVLGAFVLPLADLAAARLHRHMRRDDAD
ncbi:MAG: hypothetical protein AB7N76_05610 [Planctomycetota bacterium]